MSPVCALADLQESTPHLVRVDDEDVVLVRQGGEVFAIADLCSHAEVSLAEGAVTLGAIECWLHGSRFDLRTGAPSGPPAVTPVPTYPVSIVAGPDGEPAVVVSVRAND